MIFEIDFKQDLDGTKLLIESNKTPDAHLLIHLSPFGVGISWGSLLIANYGLPHSTFQPSRRLVYNATDVMRHVLGIGGLRCSCVENSR